MENKIVEMKQLIEKLNKASDAYYNTGNTIMSDKEFDTKLAELDLLENETGIVMSNSPTQRVGAPVLNKLDKVIHEFKPMLSLAKVHSAEEIIKFANGKDLIAMLKLDGLSVRLTYENGKLVRGETRGNGVEGSDVTEHIKQFKNVPLSIDKSGTYIVDGEAIITDDDFRAINAALPEGEEFYKNSRNLASGTLALLDTSLVKERHLRFVLWDGIVGNDHKNFSMKLHEARELGFECVEWIPVSSDELFSNRIIAVNESMFMVAKELGLPIDGVVWKHNDVAYGETLGQTSHHFCNAVAFKAKQDVYETTLKDIEFTMGKTGVLTPVAIFEPVEIDGSTVERASLHNLSVMKELGVEYVGQKVNVFKANQIIPQISSAEPIGPFKDYDDKEIISSIEIPNTCPVCGGRTEIRKDNDTEILVCTNDYCQGKLLGKLSHAASKNALNIDGLSEATLEFMVEELNVKSIKDLYQIPFYNEVYERWIETPGFGKRSVDKLRDAIQKSRNTTLERFLYAQSVNLIGKTASKDISKHCKGSIDTFCDIMANGNKREFLSIDGFGQTMLESLENWYENHWVDFLALKSEFNFESKTETTQNKNVSGKGLDGKSFCITGKLECHSNRDELVAIIEQNNGRYVTGVTSKTDYLINNDVTSGTGKNKKAKDLNIPIISEKDFLKMIGI